MLAMIEAAEKLRRKDDPKLEAFTGLPLNLAVSFRNYNLATLTTLMMNIIRQ